ncbi:MAG TPA: multicopper oxidase domain-containing protein [Bradyrhizobium sp.]|nr:multicopper oxidase domain-containing protein [Bradyrhizobium sp.]
MPKFSLIKSGRWITAAVASLVWMPVAASAGEFVEPPVFASEHGVLDLLMIAKAAPVPSISYTAPRGITVHPTGWIYEVCRRAVARGDNECPAGAATIASYGGVRLALQPGDKLKIRLVNRLPKLDPVKVTHSADAGGANLPLNLTNLHTHGMIVPARAPTLADPTFGDDIFVEIYNSANGTPVPQTTHQHGSLVKDFVDYRIDVPANHPSGAFWFHPHVHGLALNQVSAGLSGIISVGRAGDYANGDLFHEPFPEAQVRHLILKDMQVLAHGTVQFDNGPAMVAAGEVLYQEDPAFCSQLPATPGENRQGSCPGADNSAAQGPDYKGGRWFFTVSGEPFPTIKIDEPDGELWRLTNASGSASYDLQLVDDATHKPLVVQLVSVDGVSIDVPPATGFDTMVEMGGARFKVVNCPPQPLFNTHSAPVCISEFVMMPSSRAEVWVTYRNEAGRLVASPKGATATFKTIGLTTGPAGDAWPAVDLAKVVFDQSGPRKLAEFALDIRGDAESANQDTGIFRAAVPGAVPVPVAAQCKPLAPGHRRRIFFGLADPANNPDGFGLGYEEVDAHGEVVTGTRLAVRSFDPSQNIICVPLDPGQKPAHETWELVNLATENHNFHIHQTKFRFVGRDGDEATQARGGIMEDNVPLPVAVPRTQEIADKQNGYCTIAQWHSGQCSSVPQVVEIPFSQLGEFVYHCHILEHEDGGMMAKIRVVPAPM